MEGDRSPSPNAQATREDRSILVRVIDRPPHMPRLHVSVDPNVRAVRLVRVIDRPPHSCRTVEADRRAAMSPRSAPHASIRRKDGAKPTAVSRQRLYVPALSSPLFVRKLERVPPFGGPRGYRSGAIPPDLSCHIPVINTSNLLSRSMSCIWVASVPSVVGKKAL